MKATQVLALLLPSAAFARVGLESANPVGKVLELLTGLSAKIEAEGAEEAKTYKEFVDWCEDAARSKGFEIHTAESEIAKLGATIDKATSGAEVADSKIKDLAADIATGDAELTNATGIREREAADFTKSDAVLVEAIGTLGRAITLLEREMAKKPVAFAQAAAASVAAGGGVAGVVASLTALVEAAALPGADKERLVGLVQDHQEASDADDEDTLGAPAAAAYKTHSTDIVEVLEDLKEKAEEELSEMRKAEANAKHNYAMVKQSLDDQQQADSKDLSEEKAAKAASQETKTAAQGDLEMTQKSLADSQAALQTAQTSCVEAAANHEATVKARDEELKAIAEATQVLQVSTGNATEYSYSLLQVRGVASRGGSRVRTRADLANFEIVNLVKRLAEKQHSSQLAQLASRITAVLQYGAAAGEDPFGKVKALITSLIGRLEQEASGEATEKSYCDDEMAKTDSKQGELQGSLESLSAKIDQAASQSAGLKSEVAELQASLATLAREQADMGEMRQEGHAAYVQSKADLEAGLAGVRQALSVLREYYSSEATAALVQSSGDLAALMRQSAIPAAHSKASGAGSSIIGLLEVVESDFATGLAKEEMQEADSAADYEKVSQAGKISKTTKEQDVKYKMQAAESLDKRVAELSSDKATSDTELAAVSEYGSKLKERCIAKPTTYEERKRRREAEIDGLKEALSILDGEAALVQRGKHSARRHRGFLAAGATH